MKEKIFITLISIALFSFTFMSCNQTSKKNNESKEDSTEVHNHDEHDHDGHNHDHDGHNHETHWSYDGDTGPDKWAVINEEYKDCNGKNQSPVDISGAERLKSLQPLDLNYLEAKELDIINNGHSVQVSYADGTFGDYHILQFHFHCPSEHTINGKQYPMEVHLVHSTAEGELAVIGVMVEEGAENEFFKKLWEHIPEASGEEKKVEMAFNVENMLPEDRGYYHLTGSLTTPPCTEGVQWYVLSNPVTASKEQIEKIAAAMPKHNARPVQPLNDRKIVQY